VLKIQIHFLNFFSFICIINNLIDYLIFSVLVVRKRNSTIPQLVSTIIKFNDGVGHINQCGVELMSTPFPNSQYITINGIKTHYVDQGNPANQPIVFIHGAFSSTAAWDDVLNFLQADYRLIALDLISHGYTDRVIDRPITIELIADHVHGFLDALNLPSVPIVGNSLGCMIACYYAFLHPDRVQKLVLLDGGLGVTPIPVKDIKGAPKMAAMTITKYVGDALFPLIGKKMIVDWYNRCVVNKAIITPERIEKNQAPLRQKHSIKALNLLLRALFKFGDPGVYAKLGIAEYLSAMQSPVLIAWGDSDRILPRWIGQEMIDRLPNGQMEVLEHCGHLPQEELPERTAKLIHHFI